LNLSVLAGGSGEADMNERVISSIFDFAQALHAGSDDFRFVRRFADWRDNPDAKPCKQNEVFNSPCLLCLQEGRANPVLQFLMFW